MTHPSWAVFVEGPSDARFLTCVLQHLGITAIAIHRIGGGISQLEYVRQQMLRSVHSGKGIAILVDADSNIARSRKKLHNAIERHDLPIAIDRAFLLPDNEGTGCLETLLERVAVARHREIFNCFEQYEACVSKLDSQYFLPDMKARIYAYCEALRIETDAKKRDYRDSAYWNLDTPALEPLRAFLRGLQADEGGT